MSGKPLYLGCPLRDATLKDAKKAMYAKEFLYLGFVKFCKIHKIRYTSMKPMIRKIKGDEKWNKMHQSC